MKRSDLQIENNQDIPEKLRKTILARSTVKERVLSILRDVNEPLYVEEILIALYKKYNKAYMRPYVLIILKQLQKDGKVEAVKLTESVEYSLLKDPASMLQSRILRIIATSNYPIKKKEIANRLSCLYKTEEKPHLIASTLYWLEIDKVITKVNKGAYTLNLLNLTSEFVELI